MIKCVGCYELKREKIALFDNKHLVVYVCPLFPYQTVIGGLLHPGKGITEAVKDCPKLLSDLCILCDKPWVTSYGTSPNVFTCKEHNRAWGKWLAEHSERRAYLAPLGRLRLANWVEVFREFIEDMREETGGCPLGEAGKRG